jgi:HPt (histidine-containing phosphotransfer) domain-containing protein
LGQAIASQDTATASAAAHKLKGSCGNVGAEGLVALCQRIETSGRSSRVQELPELMRQVTREFSEVNQALDDVKAGKLTVEKIRPESV